MLYLLIGGFLFHISECPTELLRLKSKEVTRLKDFVSLFPQLEKLEDLQERAAESPADIALHTKIVAGIMILISHLENIREDLRDKLSQPKLTLIMNDGNMNTYITEGEEVECEKWSLYNSIFFGFTSITTIGYGLLVPQTQLGRGLCIIYTIIGIPINSLLVGCIGTTLLEKGSKLFCRFCYNWVKETLLSRNLFFEVGQVAQVIWDVIVAVKTVFKSPLRVVTHAAN